VKGGSTFALNVPSGKIASVYLLEGDALANGESLRTSDFVQAADVDSLDFETDLGATIFVITSPATVGYRTYGQLMRG
jgi:hypothetical protein